MLVLLVAGVDGVDCVGGAWREGEVANRIECVKQAAAIN